MIVVAKDDVLKALKKFRRLAKQDLLACQLTPNPEYWIAQAEARRDTYAKLMDLINDQGLDYAYRYAQQKYADLPFFINETEKDPNIEGQKQALEMFFMIVQPSRHKMQTNIEQTSSSSAGKLAVNAQANNVE